MMIFIEGNKGQLQTGKELIIKKCPNLEVPKELYFSHLELVLIL